MTIQDKDIRIAQEDLVPHSYPSEMLFPFFPEATGLREYCSTLNGVDIKIYVEGNESILATPGDRRILGILSAALARQIRAGLTGRHLHIQIPELLQILEGERRNGGEDYTRLREKLERLMATVIETSEPIAGDRRRNRRFRWVVAFEDDSENETIAGNTKQIRISLSEE